MSPGLSVQAVSHWLCDREGNVAGLEVSESDEAPAEEVWL